MWCQWSGALVSIITRFSLYNEFNESNCDLLDCSFMDPHGVDDPQNGYLGNGVKLKYVVDLDYIGFNPLSSCV